MSIWNKHLSGMFAGNKAKAEKKGDFQCPLCKEWVKAGELRAHAAKDDERFKEGLMIADQAGSPRMGRDRRCGRTNHYARNSRFNRQWKPRTTLPPLSMSVSFVRRVIPSSV